ncbi:uncharacterized protein [Nicotiana tomentosiformis]|uniref:uncharacterized protein n=1 Tax=Nicotiana tomentosiformis TaxID=4098 RepID=UPI00388C49AB
MILHSNFGMVEDVYRLSRNLGMWNTRSIVCTQHYQESLFFDSSSNHVLLFFSDIPCFWSEGFGNIFGGIKGGGTSHIDSLHREGQFNFPASHFKWNPLVICFVAYHGDIKFGLSDVGYPALEGLGASAIAPWMWRLDCSLWDYLRRSGAYDFLFSLSSGVDNFSSTAIVLSMCQLVVKETANGHEQATSDAFRIDHHTEGQFATDSEEVVKHILTTVFLGSENSFNFKATIAQAKVLVFFTVISYHLLKYILWMHITDDSGVTCIQPRRISAETWELEIDIKMKDVEQQVNTNSLVGFFPLYSLLYQHEEINNFHPLLDR